MREEVARTLWGKYCIFTNRCYFKIPYRSCFSRCLNFKNERKIDLQIYMYFFLQTVSLNPQPHPSWIWCINVFSQIAAIIVKLVKYESFLKCALYSSSPTFSVVLGEWSSPSNSGQSLYHMVANFCGLKILWIEPKIEFSKFLQVYFTVCQFGTWFSDWNA